MLTSGKTQTGSLDSGKTTEARNRHKLFRLSIPVMVTLTLSLTLAFTTALSIYNTVVLDRPDSRQDSGGKDSGWAVVDSQVSTSRSVVINDNLAIKKDLKIGSDGSFLELGGVDCAAEDVAPSGTGRLCFDRYDKAFKVSLSGTDFVQLSSSTDGGGVSCWDLNSNHAADPSEDVNADGSVDILDCRGDSGAAGIPGLDGAPGQDCWDLNGDHSQNQNEDVNGDGRVDVYDCRGSDGAVGASGLACWDLNGNGQPDKSEDQNGDFTVDVLDCSGGEGPAGLPGAACWDLNGNGATDPGEDTNRDGRFDVYDCRQSSQVSGRASLRHDALPDELQELLAPYYLDCCQNLNVYQAKPVVAWAKIVLPDPLYGAWKVGLGDSTGLNVQLTAAGPQLHLFFMVSQQEPAVYVLDEAGGAGSFDYLIQAVQ